MRIKHHSTLEIALKDPNTREVGATDISYTPLETEPWHFKDAQRQKEMPPG